MTSMINVQSYELVDYSDLWKQVEKAEKKGLPQTAVKYLDKLEALAEKAEDDLELLVIREKKAGTASRIQLERGQFLLSKSLSTDGHFVC